MHNVMTLTETISNVKNLFSRNVIKAKVLPAILIYCTAVKRSGLSAAITTSQIIENNKKLGIDTGPNPDGSDNIVNQHDYNMVKCIFDGMRNNGVVHVCIPAGSIMFSGSGVNGGGAMNVVGYNMKDTIAYGLIR